MKVLALMPFSANFDDVYASLQLACQDIKIPHSSENGGGASTLSCTRVDEVGGTSAIMDKLLESIRSATICIVDITGNNQNVIWELGYAMALEKPVVILTQDREDVKFDLNHFRNIKYKRDELKSSLRDCLREELNSLVRTLPDPSVIPKNIVHRQAIALAMSTASPAYFLDANFVIQYMNEAAALLFQSPQSRKLGTFWEGRPLSDFINVFWKRLENLAEIEKNLQIQTEEIQAAQRAKQISAITPYNIETVVLRTVSYGTIELQKIGVAVTDPKSGEVAGWVVSFNPVKPHDYAKFHRFYEKHKSIVEGRLFRQSKQQAINLPPVEKKDSPDLDDWIKGTMKIGKFEILTEYSEQQECLAFAFDIMRGDRYGLESISALPVEFFNYPKSRYLKLSSPDKTALAGVFRINLDHNMHNYIDEMTNLDTFTNELVCEGKKFADVGCYICTSINNIPREKCLAWMLGYASCLCEYYGHDYVYAQVPTYLIRKFKTFMFRPVGKQFQCDGWRGDWTPILLCCQTFRDKEYMKAWIERAEITIPPYENFIQWSCEGYELANREIEKGFV